MCYNDGAQKNLPMYRSEMHNSHYKNLQTFLIIWAVKIRVADLNLFEFSSLKIYESKTKSTASRIRTHGLLHRRWKNISYMFYTGNNVRGRRLRFDGVECELYSNVLNSISQILWIETSCTKFSKSVIRILCTFYLYPDINLIVS